jgi:hypothetical protein
VEADDSLGPGLDMIVLCMFYPRMTKKKSMDAGNSAYVVDISETANYPLAIAMVEGCDKVFFLEK